MLIKILIETGVLIGVAVLSAILLALAETYLQTEGSKEEHIDKIEFYLPSYNCGACGHVNCRQVAKEIVNGKIKDIKISKVISKDNATLIKEYCKNNNIEIN